MAFGLGSATHIEFGQTKGSMSVGPIRTQRQRMLEFTDALSGPVRKYLDVTPSHVGPSTVRRNFPLAHLTLAAALGLTGALDEARTAARTGLALNSGFTIRRLLAAKQSDNPIYLVGLERFCEGMRLAGVPEG